MATELKDNIVVAKISAMLLLGLTAFIIILLPVFIGRRVTSKKCSDAQKNSDRSDFILSLFLAFGGGVLLCTAFLHLLPEVTENITTLQNDGILPKDFPLSLAPLIMCCGFFVMYIVEEFVHLYLHSRHHKKSLQGCENPLNLSSEDLVASDKSMVETYKDILKQDMLQVTFSHPREEDLKIFPHEPRNYSTCSYSQGEEVNHNRCIVEERDAHCDHDHQPHDHQGPHHHDPESGAHSHIVTTSAPSLRELLLVLALTVHEAFEGLAIGLEAVVGSVWYLTLAVAIHKSVIAFCVGIELVSGHISLPLSIFYAVVFSCASPFGIAVGLLLTTDSDDSLTTLLSVILQGMATGTLVYVVFFEVLKREGHGGGGIWQMSVVILGFVVMAGVMCAIDA